MDGPLRARTLTSRHEHSSRRLMHHPPYRSVDHCFEDAEDRSATDIPSSNYQILLYFRAKFFFSGDENTRYLLLDPFEHRPPAIASYSSTPCQLVQTFPFHLLPFQLLTPNILQHRMHLCRKCCALSGLVSITKKHPHILFARTLKAIRSPCRCQLPGKRTQI